MLTTEDVSRFTDAELQQKKQILESEVATYDTVQKSLKELLAAAYGTMCSRFFRWYDDRLARSITISGQLTVKTAENALNKYLREVCAADRDYIIAMDTDSVYITLDDFVRKFEEVTGDSLDSEQVVDFLDRAADDAINPIIDQAYEELADNMNAFANKMVMKREAISSRAIWTGKKKYALSVNDNEGLRYTKPDIKVVGLEVVRTSTPKTCRDKIEKALDIILHEDDNDKLVNHVSSYRKEFFSLPFADVAFPRSINKIDQYRSRESVYTKSTPLHVKAALLYNHHTDANVMKIGEGDKIRFAYLREPNPWGDKVIGIPDSAEIPEGWDVDKFIDYPMQFEKAFLAPIERLCNVRGWHTKKVNSLDRFFGA